MNLHSSYKKVLTYTCLLLYAISLLKPCATYLGYQVNFNYISTVLCVKKDLADNCCKGKCFLGKQLKEDAAKESKSPVASFKTLQHEIAPEEISYQSFLSSSEIDRFFILTDQPLVLIGKTTPPPQGV